MKKYLVVFVLLCFCTSVASTATCQKKKAKVLFDKGVAALEQREYRDAIEAFNEAYELSPHWAVLAHIGTCHAKLDEPVEAIKVLEKYLEEGGAKIPPEEREIAKDLIKEQKGKVGTLVLSVRKGVSAEVDGESIGTAPFDEIPLRTGKHTVSVIFGEDDIVERKIDIEGGQDFVLRIKEEKRVVAAPPPPEEKKEEEEAKQEEVPAEEPEPAPVEEEEPEEEDEPSGEGSLVPFYATLGVAAAGLVAGGVGWGLFAHFRLSANNYDDELTAFRNSDPEFLTYSYDLTCATQQVESKPEQYYCDTEWNKRDFLDKSDLWFIVGIAGSGVAVVSGALAIIFYINKDWFGRSDDTAAITLTPVVGRYQNGLQLNVAF